MSHLGHHDVLRYLKREQSSEERRQSLDHLRRCERCQDLVEEEQALDHRLRQGLGYEQAPPGLIDAIRTGLERQTQPGDRRRWAWISAALAAAAVLLAVMVNLAPVSSGQLAEGLVAAGVTTGGIHDLHGHLVCVGCARMDLGNDTHRRCRSRSGEHVTGLQDDSGRVWQFMAGEVIDSLVNDPALRGQRLQVSARLYDNIDYLRVYTARTL